MGDRSTPIFGDKAVLVVFSIMMFLLLSVAVTATNGFFHPEYDPGPDFVGSDASTTEYTLSLEPAQSPGTVNESDAAVSFDDLSPEGRGLVMESIGDVRSGILKQNSSAEIVVNADFVEHRENVYVVHSSVETEPNIDMDYLFVAIIAGLLGLLCLFIIMERLARIL